MFQNYNLKYDIINTSDRRQTARHAKLVMSCFYLRSQLNKIFPSNETFQIQSLVCTFNKFVCKMSAKSVIWIQ